MAMSDWRESCVLKRRNRPEKTICAVKNTDIFTFNSKIQVGSLGKINKSAPP
jgi:hypothetical protein